MAKRKFQIGDQVKVIKEMGIKVGEGHGIKIGRKGKVVDYQIDSNYPYEVKFRKTKKESYPYDNFNVKELELVN